MSSAVREAVGVLILSSRRAANGNVCIGGIRSLALLGQWFELIPGSRHVSRAENSSGSDGCSGSISSVLADS